MRRGAWMETITGRRFFPDDPRPEDVHLEDIAHALSRQCRFGGHVREFYSVAQHCVIVSRNVPHEYAFAALLHDAAEAYVVDLPSPLKWNIRDHAKATGAEDVYARMERLVHAAICQRFELPQQIPESVKIADMRALFTERRDLRPPSTRLWEDQANYPPFDEAIIALPPDEARDLFKLRFAELHTERFARTSR